MRDEGKRAAVRKLLRTRRGRKMSDREAAAEAGVGRFLVKSVRMELIGLGLIERPEPGEFVGEVAAAKMYRPGTSSRGGYVLDEHGRSVQRHEWEKRQRRKDRGGR